MTKLRPGSILIAPVALLVVVLLLALPVTSGVGLNRHNEPAGRSNVVAVAAENSAAVQAWADLRRAQVSLLVVDRESGERMGIRADEPIFAASVAKLFIASQLAYLDATGERPASPEDVAMLGTMLEASDDAAGSYLWNVLGGPAIIEAVAARFGLTSTTPPVDGNWWNTTTTVTDIAAFYDQLLDDAWAAGSQGIAGGPPGPSWAERILGHLQRWKDVGADGYDQRFGLPAAVGNGQLVALKQGWMCCVDAKWIHLTTGIFGPHARYIFVAQVAEDVQYPAGAPPSADGITLLPDTSFELDLFDESAAHARETMSGVVEALFPAGALDVDSRG